MNSKSSQEQNKKQLSNSKIFEVLEELNDSNISSDSISAESNNNTITISPSH